MHTASPTVLRAATVVLTSAIISGCSSSFFKITTENGETPAPPAAQTPPVAQRPPVAQSPPPKATVTAAQAVDTAPRPAPTVVADSEPVAQSSDSAGIERLVQLATVWSTVAHFHPFIGTRGVAWDSAVVRAVPKVRSARSAGEMQAALIDLVGVLGDPATRFDGQTSASSRTRMFDTAVTRDSVLLIVLPSSVTARDTAAAARLADDLEALAVRARAFSRVVIDVRGSESGGNAGAGDDHVGALNVIDASGLAGALTTDALWLPSMRRRVVGTLFTDTIPTEFQIGGAPAAWRSDMSSFVQGTAPQLTRPAPRQRGRNRQPLPAVPVARNIVVVANAFTMWPASIAALVASERAALFADGAAHDANMVATTRIDLPNTGTLRVRIAELGGDHGMPAIVADSVFAPSRAIASAVDSSAPAMVAALQAVRSGQLPQRRHAAVAPAQLPASYDTAAYPTMGARVLGVFRLWSALRTLHVNRDAYDDDIDEQFRRTIAMAEAATSPREYAAAIIALAAHADDSGVDFEGAAFDEAFGEFALPFEVRWASDRPVVARVATDEASRASGIVVGDEITAVEGFPIVSWLSETRRARPASNDWSRLAWQMDALRRGGRGATWLKVRDARGIERQVTVDRSVRYGDSSVFRSAPREFMRTFDGGIRYIDATASGSADATIFRDARAVLVDLRGAVTDGGAALARSLTTDITQPIARVIRRGASAPCAAISLRAAHAQCPDERSSTPMLASGNNGESPFNGLVAVLIDEHTDRRGELLALELEVAGARLLGNATAGALAPSSWIALPGRLRVSMPLVEVRRADGGQLHRVGLTPMLELHPTVRGVRAGVDDVRDRAVAWIQQELSPAPRRRR